MNQSQKQSKCPWRCCETVQNAGVEIGQQFKVINEDIVIEVVAVQPDESVAKIITGRKGLSEGQRIEAST